MAIRPFLAMTAAEMREFSVFPGEIAWMACHFSPYGTGLSNLPKYLPPGSLLILDDITPIHGHDADHIAEQLLDRIEALDCCALLLDFQRPGYEESTALAQHLAEALPCPVGVSELYAGDADCPILLPPVPPSVPLEEYIAPWNRRDIWLELALDSEVITLTEDGSSVSPLPFDANPDGGFAEENLCCHYRIESNDTSVQFTLWRTQDDLTQLLEKADSLGIPQAVGLYQELWKNENRPA